MSSDEEEEEIQEEEEPSNLPLITAIASLNFNKNEKKELYGEMWTLSSAKPGNGIEQLRSNNLETYWQSDGSHQNNNSPQHQQQQQQQQQIHTISIEFSKRTKITDLALYLDYSLDESYTPKEVLIKSGLTSHDLEEVSHVRFHEPVGWCVIPLDENNVDTFLLHICIHCMHQNGRDAHLRSVRIFGPSSSSSSLKTTIGRDPDSALTEGYLSSSKTKISRNSIKMGDNEIGLFQTVELSQFGGIR